MIRSALIFPVAAISILVGCSGAQSVFDDTARSAAKSVVTPIVSERFPKLPAEDVSNCIIDNASGSEILTLAKGATLGVDNETIEVVSKIARRPETANCIAKVVLQNVKIT